MSLSVKNWENFQHYKNRTPPWIKLYKSLLDDPEYHSLSPLAAKYLPLIWLAAAEHSTTGDLPAIDKLAFRLHLASKVLAEIITELNHWINQDASVMLASCEQSATPEGDRERETDTEREGDSNARTREPKPKSKRKTILDPSWEPNDTHQELAQELGLDLSASVTDFRDYEAAHRRTMADWDAAFRTWLRKAVDFKKNRRPTKIEEHNRIAQDLDAWAKRKMEEKRGRVIDCELPKSHFGLLPREVRAGKRDR